MSFILRLKRAETPLFKRLKSVYHFITTVSIPVPNAAKPLGRFLYNLHFAVRMAGNRFLTFFYREPLFRSRCESVGRRLTMYRIPEIPGHTYVYIDDDVAIQGKIGIYSGRVNDRPVLRIGSHVSVGHQVMFSCNQEIVIEDHVLIANNCTISDNDGHPVDAEQRAAGLPPPASRIKPVRVCEKAWIGAGCYILKGVTVGEGAIVGAGSVVTEDVPPYTVVAGNPARPVRKLSEPVAGINDQHQPRNL